MFRFYLVVGCVFCSLSIYGQKIIGLSLFAGPNITNVIDRKNSLPVLSYSAELPTDLNSINYLVGIVAKKNMLKSLNFEASLLYERIGNSSGRFNARYKPVIDERIHYAGVTMELVKAPLQVSNINLGIGGFFYYAVNKRFGKRDLFIEKRPLWGVLTSIRFPLTEKISFNTKLSIGLNSITNNTISSVNSVTESQNVFSLQFVFLYELFDLGVN